jgi:hypothetical protein
MTLETTIATGVANNGRFDWVIPQTVPAAGDYVVRVTRPAGGGATAGSDVSDGVFSIGAGTGVYYVNDGTFAAGDWTTAPGDDANSGLDPAHPKATVGGVLSAYALGATDVIRVDAGNYLLAGNVVVTPADSGVTIRGYFDPAFPARKAVLDRGSRATNAFVFEIAGADDVTVDRLSMTGAYQAFVAPFGADADRLTLTNSEVYGSTWYGIYVGGQNDDWTISGNRIYNNYANLQGESAARLNITGNLIYGATYIGGIRIGNGQGSTFSGNEVYGNVGAGISARSRPGPRCRLDRPPRRGRLAAADGHRRRHVLRDGRRLPHDRPAGAARVHVGCGRRVARARPGRPRVGRGAARDRAAQRPRRAHRARVPPRLPGGRRHRTTAGVARPRHPRGLDRHDRPARRGDRGIRHVSPEPPARAEHGGAATHHRTRYAS